MWTTRKAVVILNPYSYEQWAFLAHGKYGGCGPANAFSQIDNYDIKYTEEDFISRIFKHQVTWAKSNGCGSYFVCRRTILLVTEFGLWPLPSLLIG